MTTEQLDALLGRIKSKATGVDVSIGIDPGTHTGVAVMIGGVLRRVESMGIIQAMDFVTEAVQTYRGLEKTVHVYVEDTRKLRLPKALQSKGRERGAGSVARDMSVWSEFLTARKIPHTMCGLSPKEFREGKGDWFSKKTGWKGKSNEHGRAAAGLIWKR